MDPLKSWWECAVSLWLHRVEHLHAIGCISSETGSSNLKGGQGLMVGTKKDFFATLPSPSFNHYSSCIYVCHKFPPNFQNLLTLQCAAHRLRILKLCHHVLLSGAPFRSFSWPFPGQCVRVCVLGLPNVCEVTKRCWSLFNSPFQKKKKNTTYISVHTLDFKVWGCKVKQEIPSGKGTVC